MCYNVRMKEKPIRTIPAVENDLVIYESKQHNLIKGDCIYIPQNIDTTEDSNLEPIENLDVYVKPSDFQYLHYTAKVWIEWNPNIYRLKKFGIYSEDETPILARFGRKAVNDDGREVDVDICRNSYIKVALQYIPGNYVDVDSFEIVNLGMGNMHDASIIQVYRLAPRRVA